MDGFKQWFEIYENPPVLPKNDAEVQHFVKTMSDSHAHGIYLALTLHDREIYHVLYERPIAGNLLLIESQLLKNCRGVISSHAGAKFAFKRGDMLIRFPPTSFTEQDRQSLSGIVVHELQHAFDFANQEIDFENQTEYTFNFQQYKVKLGEARAYIQELTHLLKQVGDPEKVWNVVARSGTFGIHEDYLGFARGFLDEQMRMNEDIMPPVVARNVETEAQKRIAAIVQQAYQTFRFGNFLVSA